MQRADLVSLFAELRTGEPVIVGPGTTSGALYQADHRELVAALRARDADRAVEAMRTHLARVSSHLFDEAS